MKEHNIRAISLQTAQRAHALGITQEDIAKSIGASQSQVSRILSGHSKKRSNVFNEVCNYVNKYANGISADLVRQNDELIDALANVWDGSAHHSEALATVIRSLAVLGEHTPNRDPNNAPTVKKP